MASSHFRGSGWPVYLFCSGAHDSVFQDMSLKFWRGDAPRRAAIGNQSEAGLSCRGAMCRPTFSGR